MNCTILTKSPLASIAVAALVSGALQAAPTPDPMGFAAAPAPYSETEIAMVAATATGTGTIEYYFTETSGNPGATDSGWQTEPSYTDGDLDPNTTYTYKVKAREGDLSETAASPDESATTDVALIYEGFNYADGNGFDYINGESGGNGFAGAWIQTKSPTAEAIAPGLTFGDLTTVGNSAKSASTLWGHMTRPIGTTLSDAGLMDDGATLWFSAIFDNSYPANSGVKNGTGAFSSSGGTQEWMADGEQGIGILQSNFSKVLAAHWSPNPTTSDTGEGAAAGPVLFVGKIEWGATGGDAETLTVYTPDASLAQGEVKATLTVPALDQSTFNTLAVLTKDHGMIDEIPFRGQL